MTRSWIVLTMAQETMIAPSSRQVTSFFTGRRRAKSVVVSLMALGWVLLTSPSQVEEVEKPHDRIASKDE
jgi:hypothetical protein